MSRTFEENKAYYNEFYTKWTERQNALLEAFLHCKELAESGKKKCVVHPGPKHTEAVAGIVPILLSVEGIKIKVVVKSITK
jgi:RNA polymerase subunit RPABC4/transcription elongation factor Spt4